ncbi:MAG: hypothetical protein KQH63_17090 [Desulfobulbaceae bacterium]|nr:hypothetical protein [Desulfobulbaceae bacterium]
MDTYFAKPERVGEDEIIREIEIVSNSPVMTSLLHSISGLLAILNEHRQILAVNDSLLEMLGIDDPSQALGLRPGEVLHCTHAHEEPAGCGTTKFCSSCGAALAIVSCLGRDKPVERICALTTDREGEAADIALLVRAHSIKIDRDNFLLLFLQDITLQQERAALERTFFHDVNNMLCGLLGASEMLSMGNSEPDVVRVVHQAALRLKQEVEIQRCLLQNESCVYHPLWHMTGTGQVREELQSFFANHPAARNKKLLFREPYPIFSFKTDISLLSRVLCNMVINALEATAENASMEMWLEQNDTSLSFCVWNDQVIPSDIALRVFQRNFSTKKEAGRGVGTYSMKLFGEKILGGKVSFTTSEDQGTVFRFSLPL